MMYLPSVPESATLLDVLRAYPDLDHLVLAPIRGWRAHIDQAGGVTLRWPHHAPMLADLPLDLPEGCAAAVRAAPRSRGSRAANGSRPLSRCAP